MVNQFEQFTPAAAAPATDDLGSVRVQQYSAEAMTAMSPASPAVSQLPDVTVSYGKGFEPVSALADDGPGAVTDNSLDGQNPRREPAELGNAHHIVELILSDSFQNRDGTITAAGQESIRAAIGAAGNLNYTLNPFQTYEARAQQVQDYINQHAAPPISLTFDRDRASANTATGSRPFIMVGGIGGTRIPFNR